MPAAAPKLRVRPIAVAENFPDGAPARSGGAAPRTQIRREGGLPGLVRAPADKFVRLKPECPAPGWGFGTSGPPRAPAGRPALAPSNYFFFVFFAAFGFAAAFVAGFFALRLAVIGMWSDSSLHPEGAPRALKHQHIEQIAARAQYLDTTPPMCESPVVTEHR